jgi:hypothetical protein
MCRKICASQIPRGLHSLEMYRVQRKFWKGFARFYLGSHCTVVLKEGSGGIRDVIYLKTHVHIVKSPQNHESGLRFHF